MMLQPRKQGSRVDTKKSVFKILQPSIKDSLLHHLFPRLDPFTMATECWLCWTNVGVGGSLEEEQVCV